METATSNQEDQRPGVDSENGAADQSVCGQRLVYTIPGVLHFLQTECAKIEAERAQFELERTEFQARIAFLEGERRAQENLKKDLVRRIRMLEHALAKERERSNANTQGNVKTNDENKIDENKSDENQDIAKFGLSSQPVEDLEELLQNLGQTKTHKARNQMISEGRQLLRKYLQEIGYADTIVDVRSARVRALLGFDAMSSNSMNKQSPGGYAANGGYPPSSKVSNQTNSPGDKGRLAEELVSSAEQSVIDTFAFLKASDSSAAESDDKEDIQGILPELKKFLRPKKETDGENKESAEDTAALNELNGLLNSTVVTTGEATKEYDFAETTVDAAARAQGVRPDVRFVLRSHYDAIRYLVFHPTEPVVISASDDSTIKLWSLDRQNHASSLVQPAVGRNGQFMSPTVVSDLEPKQTFRGQCKPVLSVAMGMGGERLYTGALDGSMACYSITSFLNSASDIYDPFNPSTSLAFVPKAHKDAVWELVPHPNKASLLASCGADGGISVWNLGSVDDPNNEEETPSSSNDKYTPVLVRTMCDGVTFASVDFSRIEYTQLIGASVVSPSTKTSSIYVFDFETGCEIAKVDQIPSAINQIIAHPTLPLVIVACDDGHIRIVDIAQATTVHPASPPLENAVVATLPTPAAVSSVAVDQSGVYLLAGCKKI